MTVSGRARAREALRPFLFEEIDRETLPAARAALKGAGFPGAEVSLAGSDNRLQVSLPDGTAFVFPERAGDFR